MARAVTTETRTLQRRFRKHLNRPIATETRRVRIERAKRELTQSKRLLSEIARDTGFGEPMRMYEVFCRELGITFVLVTVYRNRDWAWERGDVHRPDHVMELINPETMNGFLQEWGAAHDG